MDLRYGLQSAFEAFEERHPQEVMKVIEISYDKSIPIPVGDCWIFENCKNVPKDLPTYLELV
jgi:hypothetical protein